MLFWTAVIRLPGVFDQLRTTRKQLLAKVVDCAICGLAVALVEGWAPALEWLFWVSLGVGFKGRGFRL